MCITNIWVFLTVFNPLEKSNSVEGKKRESGKNPDRWRAHSGSGNIRSKRARIGNVWKDRGGWTA